MNLTQTTQVLAAELAGMDFDSLPISDYNKQYTRRMQPALSYYLKIYARCLTEGMQLAGVAKIEELSLVDYGGGCGFSQIRISDSFSSITGTREKDASFPLRMYLSQTACCSGLFLLCIYYDFAVSQVLCSRLVVQCTSVPPSVQIITGIDL